VNYNVAKMFTRLRGAAGTAGEFQHQLPFKLFVGLALSIWQSSAAQEDAKQSQNRRSTVGFSRHCWACGMKLLRAVAELEP
jgi:hypothetical protein